MPRKCAPYVGRYAASPHAGGLLKGLARYIHGDIKWRLISTAPYNRDLELRLAGAGLSSARLPFPCRHTNNGWINSDLGTRLAVEPTYWRAWPEE
jgi:hypothetical protein